MCYTQIFLASMLQGREASAGVKMYDRGELGEPSKKIGVVVGGGGEGQERGMLSPRNVRTDHRRLLPSIAARNP